MAGNALGRVCLSCSCSNFQNSWPRNFISWYAGSAASITVFRSSLYIKVVSGSRSKNVTGGPPSVDRQSCHSVNTLSPSAASLLDCKNLWCSNATYIQHNASTEWLIVLSYALAEQWVNSWMCVCGQIRASQSTLLKSPIHSEHHQFRRLCSVSSVRACGQITLGMEHKSSPLMEIWQRKTIPLYCVLRNLMRRLPSLMY